MEKSSDYHPGTNKKYADNMTVVVEFLGNTKAVGMLSKDDAVRLRDRMKDAKESATAIFHVFSIFRGGLRWLNKEGLIASHYVVESFLIDLPGLTLSRRGRGMVNFFAATDGNGRGRHYGEQKQQKTKKPSFDQFFCKRGPTV